MSPGPLPGATDRPWQLHGHSVDWISEVQCGCLGGCVQRLQSATPLFLAFLACQRVSAGRCQKYCLPGRAAALSPRCLHVDHRLPQPEMGFSCYDFAVAEVKWRLHDGTDEKDKMNWWAAAWELSFGLANMS